MPRKTYFIETFFANVTFWRSPNSLFVNCESRQRQINFKEEQCTSTKQQQRQTNKIPEFFFCQIFILEMQTTTYRLTKSNFFSVTFCLWSRCDVMWENKNPVIKPVAHQTYEFELHKTCVALIALVEFHILQCKVAPHFFCFFFSQQNCSHFLITL